MKQAVIAALERDTRLLRTTIELADRESELFVKQCAENAVEENESLLAELKKGAE